MKRGGSLFNELKEGVSGLTTSVGSAFHSAQGAVESAADKAETMANSAAATMSRAASSATHSVKNMTSTDGDEDEIAMTSTGGDEDEIEGGGRRKTRRCRCKSRRGGRKSRRGGRKSRRGGRKSRHRGRKSRHRGRKSRRRGRKMRGGRQPYANQAIAWNINSPGPLGSPIANNSALANPPPYTINKYCRDPLYVPRN